MQQVIVPFISQSVPAPVQDSPKSAISTSCYPNTSPDQVGRMLLSLRTHAGSIFPNSIWENQRLEPLATTVIRSSYGLQNFFMVPCPLYHSYCSRRVVFLAQCHNLTRQDIGPYQAPCHSETSCCLRACQITKRNYPGLRPGALGKTSLYERCTIQVDCLRGMSQPFQVQIFFLNIVRTLAINSCIGQEQRPRCHVFGIYSRSSSLSTTLMDPGNLHFLQELYSPAFRCSKSHRAVNVMDGHQFY
jgi:hypothetical protein